ncbi:hypothetical protein HK100_004146, partial [Physocladia obscura]
ATSEQNKQDALMYAQDFLEKNSAEPEAIKLGPQILVDMSGGVFVWLVVACKTLDSASNASITLSMIKQTASKQVSDVDQLYFTFLNRIFGNQYGKSSELFHVLATIICAFEPLTIQAIAAITGTLISVVKNIIRKLDALLLLDVNTKTIRIFHKSFKDYLVDPTRCNDKRFAVDLPSHNTWLAEKALSCLNKFLHFNICNLPIDKLHSEIEDFSQRVSSCIPQAAAYACKYFQQHCLESVLQLPVVDENIIARIYDLFLNKAHFWIELMSLIGKTDQIVYSVTTLQYCFTGSSVSPNVLLVLKDIKRAIQLYFIPIQASALQIYNTVTVMAPTKTEFYKRYFTLLPSIIPVPIIVPQDLHWPPCMITIEGHSSSVYAVAISTDGQFVVSGSSDKTVKIWDAQTGALQRTLEGHTDIVRAVAISTNGQSVVSGSSDKMVKIWDSQTGRLLRTLEGHSDWVRAVAVSTDGQFIVSGSDDATVKIWDTQTGTLQKILEGHDGSVYAVAISTDKQFVVSGCSDKTVKIWNAETGALQRTLESHSDRVRAVVISKDGQFIVSGSSDKTVKIWDVETGTLQRTLEGHSDWVRAVTISIDGQFVASGSDDATVKIWNAQTGALQSTLEGHSGSVYTVAISTDGQFLVSGSSDKMVKILDTQTGALQRTFESHNDEVNAVAISTNEQFVVSGSEDNTVKIWDTQTGALQRTLEGHGGSVYAVVISTDGQFVVSGCVDTTVKIWDTQTGILQRTLEGHSGSVYAVAISTDGHFVVSGSGDATLKIWDRQTGVLQRTLEGHRGYVNAVAISTDGRFVVSGSFKAVKIWDAQTGVLLKDFKANGQFPPIDDQYNFNTDMAVGSQLVVKNNWLCGVNYEFLFWISPEYRTAAKTQKNLYACVNQRGALFLRTN